MFPGVLEGSQSDRLFFLEVVHLLAESGVLCDVLEENLAHVPQATQSPERADRQPEPHGREHGSQHNVPRWSRSPKTCKSMQGPENMC